MSNARKLSALFGAAGNIDPVFGAAPAGAVLPFAGLTAPGGWLLCYGQAVSRTAYAALFAALGTAYGIGDGSTTFNLPDARGRVPGGKDNMGGTAASRLTTAGSGVDGSTLGAAGGAQAVTLTAAQSGTPAHTHTASSTHTLSAASAGDHSHGYSAPVGSFNVGVGDTSYNVMPGGSSTDNAGAHTHSITGSIATTVNAAAAAGAAQPHSVTQPTLVLNYIIKT